MNSLVQTATDFAISNQRVQTLENLGHNYIKLNYVPSPKLPDGRQSLNYPPRAFHTVTFPESRHDVPWERESKPSVTPRAFQDFNEWSTTHHQIYAKIVELIKDLERHPFSGLGKPAPLKHLRTLGEAYHPGTSFHV
jgi:hypothetical protein